MIDNHLDTTNKESLDNPEYIGQKDDYIVRHIGTTSVSAVRLLDEKKANVEQDLDLYEGCDWILADLQSQKPSLSIEQHEIDRHRLQFINNISSKISAKYNSEQLEQLEALAHPYTPSIGVEIEVYQSQLLTVQERTLPEDKKQELINSRLEIIKTVQSAGLPLDTSDPWPEFALKPARCWQTIMTEIKILRELGVLHLGESYLPIHITLGGIRLDGESRVLARALDASGLSTTPQRLLMPSQGKPYWTSGDSGLYDRRSKQPGKLKAGAIDAVEFRTMLITNEADLEKTIYCMQLLGTALSAYQDYTHPDKAKLPYLSRVASRISNPFRPRTSYNSRRRKDVSLKIESQLAAIWMNFSVRIQELFEKEDMRDPAKKWREPKKFIVPIRGNFGRLADNLNEQSELPDKVRTLINAACLEIEATIASAQS